jgi:hypothetical protein
MKVMAAQIMSSPFGSANRQKEEERRHSTCTLVAWNQSYMGSGILACGLRVGVLAGLPSGEAGGCADRSADMANARAASKLEFLGRMAASAWPLRCGTWQALAGAKTRGRLHMWIRTAAGECNTGAILGQACGHLLCWGLQPDNQHVTRGKCDMEQTCTRHGTAAEVKLMVRQPAFRSAASSPSVTCCLLYARSMAQPVDELATTAHGINYDKQPFEP